MRLYIIRHADPDYSNDTITAAGQQEARALAVYLRSVGIDEVYASPLGRAQATAQYTADLLGKPVGIEPWAQDLESPWIEALNQALWDRDGALSQSSALLNALKSGEEVSRLDHPLIERNFRQVCAGLDDFLNRQGFLRVNNVYQIKRHNIRRVALFTHMGIGLTILSYLLGVPLLPIWTGFFLHPSSITTILFDERIPGIAVPRCIGLGELPHLYRAGLAPKPVGILANYD